YDYLHLPSCRCSPAAVLCRMQRKSNSEFAAGPRRTVHRNIAAVRLGDMLHQGKSQAATLGVVNQRIADAIELLENLVLLVGRYANAVINHFQLHASVFAI